MILRNNKEVLFSATRREDAIPLKELSRQAREFGKGWQNNRVYNKDSRNFAITEDMKLAICNDRGQEKVMDMTETAFSQLCTRLGVPAQYLQKCVRTGKTELVRQNIDGWADETESDFVVREYNGVARGVMSTKYAPFDSDKILRELSHTVDNGRFVPTQVHLSTDKLHIRFVDFTPLPLRGENSPVFAGFTVDSSDVGRGSLNLKYFLYRLVCTNGLMVSKGGGTLFRLGHAGEKMTESKIHLFATSMRNIDALTKLNIEVINENQGKALSVDGMEALIERAKRQIAMSEKAADRVRYLMGEDGPYDMTRWGFINSITEVAQNYTLDTRIDMESWAGDLLYK